MSSTNKRFFILGILLIFSVSTVFAETFQNQFFNVSAYGNSAGASLVTEKSGYLSGETVVIYGEGFYGFEEVSISVETYSESLQQSIPVMQWNVFANAKGFFSASIPFDSLSSENGRYTLRASGTKTGTTAETMIASAIAEAGNLDQCANGGVGDPVEPCSGAGWVNGNVNNSKAHWTEGQSVAYRQILTGFTPGSTGNTVTLGYDTTKAGKHALDYLTSFDRTETLAMGNDPCSGVVGCSLGTFTTFPIQTDSQVTAGFDQIPGNSDDITQIPGNFTLFGGTITGVSAYTVSGSYGSDSHTSVTITFTADSANMVLSWGGHIGTRADWGAANSAVFISGSPYHMSQDACSFGCGSQDRALSASAVNLDSRIIIIKQASPESANVFGFSTTGTGLSNFTLVDDGNDTDATPNSITFNNLLAPSTSGSFSVTETANGFYDLTNLTCAVTGTGGSTASPNIPASLVNITLQYGDTVTCTFFNSVTTAASLSAAGKVTDAYGQPIARTRVTIQNTNTGAIQTAYTNTFGNYRFEGLPAGDFYIVSVFNKKYVFEQDTQAFVLQDAVENLDFSASIQ
jgi:hypothetical protein